MSVNHRARTGDIIGIVFLRFSNMKVLVRNAPSRRF